MTVPSTIARDQQVGNGVSPAFTVPFRILDATHIQILQTVGGVTTTLVLVTDYSVPIVGGDDTPILFVVPPVLGAILVFIRNVPITQETDYVPNDPFPAESHERALDKLTMIAQQQGEITSRAIVLPPQTINVSTELPGPEALHLLRWNASETALENALPPEIATVADGSVVDATVSPIAAIQATKLSFTQTGAGAVVRTVMDKLQERKTAKDQGAIGDGTTEDGAALALAFAAHQHIGFPTGTYKNAASSITLPFTKTAEFESGADIATSGGGSTTLAGVVIRKGYNPGNLSGWTGSASYSYEGLSVDMGGYGPRAFGPAGTPTAVTGAVKIPSTSTIGNHASGLAGYADTSSPITGAVPIYGEGNRRAANTLVWGLNTRTQDNGFGGLTVWGYECDLNIDNVTTAVVGVEVVGGSSVEPTVSAGFKVNALGVFGPSKMRWQRAFFSDDAAAIVGVDLGTAGQGANQASQSINMYYSDGASARQLGIQLWSLAGGDSVLRFAKPDGLHLIQAFSGGTYQNNIVMYQGRVGFGMATQPTTGFEVNLNAKFNLNIGFNGAAPIAKPTVTGAKGGNAALTSLMTALANYGLVTDSTT